MNSVFSLGMLVSNGCSNPVVGNRSNVNGNPIVVKRNNNKPPRPLPTQNNNSGRSNPTIRNNNSNRAIGNNIKPAPRPPPVDTNTVAASLLKGMLQTSETTDSNEMFDAVEDEDDLKEKKQIDNSYFEGAVCDVLLLAAQEAARKEKAKEVLAEMKADNASAGKDTAWIDLKLADLDSFVHDNKADLDSLLVKEDKPTNNTAQKRGHDGNASVVDEEELLDTEDSSPVSKKANNFFTPKTSLNADNNFHFTF